eukprot:3400576-Prymnesium_polylepis.1
MGTQEHNTRKGARKESRASHTASAHASAVPPALLLGREDGLLENQRQEVCLPPRLPPAAPRQAIMAREQRSERIAKRRVVARHWRLAAVISLT